MKKEIYINCLEEETVIAVTGENKLVRILIEHKDKEISVGNIYKGKVNTFVPNLHSAFVDIGIGRHAYLSLTDTLDEEVPLAQKKCQPGQDLLVQVIKEPIQNKGAKVTQNIGLPGRYLVYMPFAEPRVYLSRKITDNAERNRLHKILANLKPGTGGLIVRSEGDRQSINEFQHDLRYLIHLWDNIKKKEKKTAAPALIYHDLGMLLQFIRDLSLEGTSIILIDNRTVYDTVLNFTKLHFPSLVHLIKLYTSKTPIFTAFKIDDQIKQLYSPRVRLPSGGYIVIQETESLCAIDVNTGSFKKRTTPEEMILTTNLEAAREIGRQIKLRNLGGIIVVDFIDMRMEKDQHLVYQEISKSLSEDKAKLTILPFNRLGLVEITRQRQRESTLSVLTEECTECKGSGRVISAHSLYLRIKKAITNLTGNRRTTLTCRANPKLIDYLKDKKSELERRTNTVLILQEDGRLSWDEYQLILM